MNKRQPSRKHDISKFKSRKISRIFRKWCTVQLGYHCLGVDQEQIGEDEAE